MDTIPSQSDDKAESCLAIDSKSYVAPFRLVKLETPSAIR